MAAKTVLCSSCGFRNNPPGAARCASCGVKLEELGKIKRTREEELERRYQQEGVNIPWLLIALFVQAVLTGAVVWGLPMVVSVFNFEGGNGMAICIPVWFVGGLLIGMISPGRTFIEPVIASFMVAVPTTFLLVEGQTVFALPTFLYAILAGIGVMFTLIGAYLGERIQLGPPPKASSD